MKALFCCLLLLAGCKREPTPEFVDFRFRIPLALTPIRDTVTVGDTLWLAADLSDQLQEFTSGQRYPVTPANFELRTSLGIFRLADPTKFLSQQPGATAAFAFVNKVGAVTRPNTTFSDLTFSYVPGRYRLRVGLIPQRRGVFCINLLDNWVSVDGDGPQPDLSYLVSGLTPEGGKRYARYLPIIYSINEGRINYHLFKDHCLLTLNSTASPPPGSPNSTEEDIFTFVVK